MTTPPLPDYDYDIKRLTKAYEKALKDVQKEIQSVFLTDYKRAQLLAIEKNISVILSDLAEYAQEWVSASISQAALEGIATTMLANDVVETFDEALKLATFNQANRRFVDAAIADTQADLLAVTQNMNRQAKLAIRKATAEATRSMLTRGDNAIGQLSKDIRKRIEQIPDMAILDAAGRRWRVGHYTDVIASTNLFNAHREASINEALAEGSMYGRISKHGATDKCKDWEGRIIKLSPDAPGDYPYIGDISRKELFHPKCKHIVTPVRRSDRV